MNDTSKIPTNSDWEWDEPHSYFHLDVEHAREKFCGNSIEEMIPRFIDLPLSASEDLYYMPKVPFQFYVMAFKTLFRTDEYRNKLLEESFASDAASTFLRLLLTKLKEAPEYVAPIMPELLPVAEYVAANQRLFEADIGIYGSFPDLLDEIKKLYSEFQSANR